MTSRIWRLLLAASLLVLAAVLATALTTTWTVSCGGRYLGIDCLLLSENPHVVAHSAPARWIGFDALVATGMVAGLLTVVAGIVCWVRHRPRVTRGYAGDMRTGLIDRRS